MGKVVKFKSKGNNKIYGYINTAVRYAREHKETALRELMTKTIPEQLREQVAKEADRILHDKTKDS